jgi:hypothetical protein
VKYSQYAITEYLGEGGGAGRVARRWLLEPSCRCCNVTSALTFLGSRDLDIEPAAENAKMNTRSALLDMKQLPVVAPLCVCFVVKGH